MGSSPIWTYSEIHPVPSIIPRSKSVDTRYLPDEYKYDSRWVNDFNAFGGSSDSVTRTYFGPSALHDFQELESMYRHNWLARGIVNSLAEDCVREGYELETEENQQDIDKMYDFADGLDLKNKIKESVILSRLYGGSICILGAFDRQELTEPIRPQDVSWFGFLMPLDRYQVWPYKWYTDPTSPKYGLPSHYLVQPITITGVFTRFIIHESRCIRFDGEYSPIRLRLRNLGWGDSVLEAAYEAIRQFGISTQSGAALMEDFVTKVYQMEGLEEGIVTEQQDIIKQRLALLVGQAQVNNLAVIGENDKLTKIGTPVQGIKDLMEQFVNYACAAAKIPKSRLYGNLSGVLGANAAGTDLRTWYDRVRVFQVNDLTAPIKRVFNLIEIVQGFKVKYDLSWKPLWQFDEETKSNNFAKMAQGYTAFVQAGILFPHEVANSMFRGDGINLTQMTLDTKFRMKMGLDDPQTLKEYQHMLDMQEASTNFRELETSRTTA